MKDIINKRIRVYENLLKVAPDSKTIKAVIEELKNILQEEKDLLKPSK